MRSPYPKTIILLILVIITDACSILKQDRERKVHAFITAFEKSLSGDDAGILSQFKTSQTKEQVMAAVRVLQNRASMGVKCVASFEQAAYVWSDEERSFRVEVPALITADTVELHESERTSLILWVRPERGNFFIGRLEGEKFYDQYVNVKNAVAAEVNQNEILAHHRIYFETAKALQKTYDTVVWVATYAGSDYYYVVNGAWNGINADGSAAGGMGLVDQDGKIIVPVKFDLVGTLGFARENVVEVKISGLTGYYNLDGEEVIPAQYDWIIPYEEGDVLALVKRDTLYGSINSKKEFHAGFPSAEARKYILSYAYLPDKMTLSSENQTLCEIPSEENFGSGTLMPASYLLATGNFKEVMTDFTTGSSEYRANTVSVETNHTFFESVTDQISAVLISISERYLDGRGGFYQKNEVAFVNSNGTMVASTKDVSSTSLSFKKIDSTLLEMRAESRGSSEDYFMGAGSGEDESEIDLPQYYYFQVKGGQSMDELTSNRKYNYTEFVKLDSSYLSGPFTFFSNEKKDLDTRMFLRDATLNDMRNEILASYGYIFPDEATLEHFKYYKWYQPIHASPDDFESQLTEIDRYNLLFLEKILGPVPGSKAKAL